MSQANETTARHGWSRFSRPAGTTGLLVALLAAALVIPADLAPIPAQAEDPDAYGDAYVTGDFGRVRYLEEGLALRRSAADTSPSGETDEVGLNSPVFPGDTALTDDEARAEIELAGGSVVRLDRETELTFLALPDPYAEVSDNTILQVGAGTIRVTAQLTENEDFRIDTPSSTVYLLSAGEFRIVVDHAGRTRVSSRRGVAEVAAAQDSVIVRAGMRTDVVAGSRPDDPSPFNTFAADSFDRWVEGREAIYRDERFARDDPDAREAYEALPDEVRPHYRELSAYGRWVHTPDYGYVWSPAEVADDWRPYRDGYWTYGPSGYFWVSDEPWGWAPYHYGRWAWVGPRGWCWIPGRVFGGAWVAWSWGSAHVGWSALDYWNRPVYVGTIYGHYYDPFCWSFLRYDHFHGRHYRHYYVGRDVVRDLGNHAVVTRPPRVSPRELVTSVESRDRALRDARGDRSARLRTLDDRQPPTRGLRETDERLASTRLEQRAAGRTATGAARSRTSGAVVRAEQPGREAATDRTRSAEARDSAVESPRFPRRTPEASVTRRTTATRARTPETTSPSGDARPETTERNRSGVTRETPRSAVGSQSEREEERRKDMYQKLSTPRTTRERSPSTPPPQRSAPARQPAPRSEAESAREPSTRRPPPKRKDPGSARTGATSVRQSSARSAPSASPSRASSPAARSHAPTPRSAPAAQSNPPARRSAPAAHSNPPARRSAPAAHSNPPARRSAPAAHSNPPARRSAPAAHSNPPARRSAPAAQSKSPAPRSSSSSSARSGSTSRSSTASRGRGKKD